MNLQMTGTKEHIWSGLRRRRKVKFEDSVDFRSYGPQLFNHRVKLPTTNVMRQVQVASSYTALLNPLVISLIALLPRETIDTTTITMSTLGLINTITMGIFLLRDSKGEVKKLPHGFFLLVGLVMFSFEIFYGIRLDRVPGDSSALHNLAILLVLIYLYGIARAWDLVGARQFHIQEVLSPLTSKGRKQSPSDEPHVESQKDGNIQGN